MLIQRHCKFAPWNSPLICWIDIIDGDVPDRQFVKSYFDAT